MQRASCSPLRTFPQRRNNLKQHNSAAYAAEFFYAMENVKNFMLRHGMNADRVELEQYTRAFYECMERGLKESQPNVPMIPTYLRLDGQLPKDRKAAVIDAGGTNYRTALLSFGDNGCRLECLERSLMPGALAPAHWSDFIKHTANSIEPLLDQTDVIGFCFSYPAEVTPDIDSRVLGLTKQVKLLAAHGRLLGADLNAELERRGLGKRKIVVLNDTPATLLGGAAMLDRERYGGFIGMVAGTGTNTCCGLPEHRVAKLGLHGDGKMLINLESGSFDGFPRGDIDLGMDNALPDTGYYIAEKMCSGAYLGELSRYTLQAAAREGLFSSAAAELILRLTKLDTPTADAWAAGKLPECFGMSDRDSAVYIIHELFDRAARCMCCNLSAILLLTGEGSGKPVCISVDGSLFKKSALFRPLLEKHMQAYAGAALGRHFEFITSDETTLLGTAAAALLN